MDEELTAAGYRRYSGDKIDVYFNSAICRHSANCVRGNAAIFTLNHRPWIMPDNAEPAEVKRVIDTCPSGALKYREK